MEHYSEYSRDSPLAIHLRTMTGNRFHPDAQVPVLRCPPECEGYWPARSDLEEADIEFTVQIYYDLIACLYQLSPFDGRDMVVVWNWKTGQVVKVNCIYCLYICIYQVVCRSYIR